LKKVLNNDKVESHSAIIPTYVVPKDLTLDEKQVYEVIKNRFTSVLSGYLLVLLQLELKL